MAAPQTGWSCTDFSLRAGESLIGTATRVDVWLMIEYSGAWERKALQASAIPEAVKKHLTTAEASIPNARVVLIRQEGRRSRQDLAFFVARSSDPDPALYRFTIGSFEEILSLDLAAVAGGDPRFGANRILTPLFLVCTDGRRDECCARKGFPIYHLMAEHHKESVWQCTHLGGHRLGPNVVVLPHGQFYGRVTSSDVPAILDPERIHLANFRGRTCLDAPAQAAETFLRTHLDASEAAGIRLAGMEALSEGRWEVRFGAEGGSERRVQLEQVGAGYGTYANCGDDLLKDVKEFRLIDIA